MPANVVRQVQRVLNEHGRAIRGTRILLLGVTYKPDIADARESPAVPVAARLQALGARLSYADPYIEGWTVNGRQVPREDDVNTAVQEADPTILLQAHRQFDPAVPLERARQLLDPRGVVPSSSARVERL